MNIDNKILYEEFGLILNQLNIYLRNCPHCGQQVRYKLVDHKFARVHCPMGCGCVTVVLNKEKGPKDNLSMVRLAAVRWNGGHWDE